MSSPCRNLGRCFNGDLQGNGLYYYGPDTEWDHPGYTCICETAYGTDCERTVFDHGGTLPYADLTGNIVVTYVTFWPNFRPFDCSALDNHVYI